METIFNGSCVNKGYTEFYRFVFKSTPNLCLRIFFFNMGNSQIGISSERPSEKFYVLVFLFI